MAPTKASKPKAKATKTKKVRRIESDSDEHEQEEQQPEEVVDEKDTEIARLQEQVKLLTIEVQTLRKHVAKTSPTAPPPPAPPKTPSRKGSRATETPSTPKGRRASTGSNKQKEKGCSCKGNCGTKICGCVKKDVYCMPSFCKCSEQCKNQDPGSENEDKENDSGNATVPEHDTSSSSDQSPEAVKSKQKKGKTGHLTAPPDSNEEEEFNPMKPRRQLPRSPLPGTSAAPAKTSKLEHPALNTSDIPLPAPKSEPDEEELSPPEEINKAEVDWEKHKQQLVECSKCKRQFFPHRVKKHEKSCIKV